LAEERGATFLRQATTQDSGDLEQGQKGGYLGHGWPYSYASPTIVDIGQGRPNQPVGAHRSQLSTLGRPWQLLPINCGQRYLMRTCLCKSLSVRPSTVAKDLQRKERNFTATRLDI